MYIGVSYDKYIKKYEAYYHHQGKKRHIGYYSDEIDAAKAVNMALEFLGRHAINFFEK